MQYTKLLSLLCVAAPAAALAQAEAAAPSERADSAEAAMGFVEATFAYGAQFGRTDYLPDSSATEFKHPVVTGFAAGATAGWLLLPKLAVIANYEYTNAWTRTGEVPTVLESVRGEIEYHTAVLGLRMFQGLGAGRLRAELGAGVLFPFETRLEHEYGPALALAGISGSGRRVDEYGWGYGLQGQLGYEVPISGAIYAGVALKVKSFQATNNERETRLRNFVLDFAATPPTATTATIEYGDNATRPTTNAVSDIRLQVAVGTRF